MIRILFLTAFLNTGPVSAATMSEASAAFQAGDYPKAFNIFKQLAEKGNGDAQYLLGNMYQEGKGTNKDFDEAVYWYQSAADSVPRASFALGLSHCTGRGIKKDARLCYKHIRSSAERGYADAALFLGDMAEHAGDASNQVIRELAAGMGQAHITSRPEALRWYLTATAYGSAKASKEFNRIQALMPKNELQFSFSSLNQMAEKGDVPTQYLGCYHTYAIPELRSRTAGMCAKPAGAGNPLAQAILATVHYDGTGVKRDKKSALQWALRSANQGATHGAYMAAKIYQEEEGRQNLLKAAKWALFAGSRGHNPASRLMTGLRAKLTRAELEKLSKEDLQFQPDTVYDTVGLQQSLFPADVRPN